jgi:hypothetical protein
MNKKEWIELLEKYKELIILERTALSFLEIIK